MYAMPRTLLVFILFFSAHSTTTAQIPPVVMDRVFCCGYGIPILTHTFKTSQGDPPITWSDFMFVGYTPKYGGMGPGPGNPATFDPLLAKFTWDSTASPRGDYEWRVTATNEWGSDEGVLLVRFFIPEPSTLLLVEIGIISLLGLTRRR
jgi:hypothetical protein